MKSIVQRVLRINAYFLSAAALLFTIAFILNTIQADLNSVVYLRNSIEQYIQQQEKDFESITENTRLLQKMVKQQYSSQELQHLLDKPYGVFVYEPDAYGTVTLKFWNNQDALPTPDILSGNKKVGFIKLSSGQFEYMHRLVRDGDGRNLIVIGLLPVHREYFMQLYSYQKKFINQPQAEKKVAISQSITAYPVKSRYGSTLFYLQAKPQLYAADTNPLSLTLVVIGIILLLIVIHNIARAIADRNYITGICFLIGVIIVLRGLTYMSPEMLVLREYGLFDPKIYSSGYILSSLGDLLINSFLVCWVVLFIKKIARKRSLAKLKHTRWHWPAFIIAILLLVSITFAGTNTIRSLIADAKISFNVTNFFSLDIYSVISFMVLANISFAYFFLSKILLQLIEPLVKEKSYLLFFLIALTGLLIMTVFRYDINVSLNMYALMWLLLYVWLLRKKAFSSPHFIFNISLALFWLFIFSLSISVIIIYENRKIELQQLMRTAEKLSEQADHSVERTINIALMYIDNNFLISNFERFKVASSNAYLKDSLTNKNFVPFLNKFDTKIYTFGADKTSLYNEESVSFDTLNTIYEIEGKRTSINLNGLRYFEKAYDKYAYICRKAVIDTTTSKSIGFMFIVSDPKRFKSEALEPELFRKNKDFLPEYSPIYSYAVYNNLQLYDYFNNYQFPTHLTREMLPTKEFVQRRKNGYDELWYKEGMDKVVIFAKKNNYVIEAITLFAYIFTTFLLLVGIFRIISLLIHSRLRWSVIRHSWQFNIRSQIHGTIIFISLFSFVVIGAATILFFNNRYQRNNQERLSKAIQIMANEVQTKMADHSVFSDMFKFYETDSDRKLHRLIREVAEIHGTDINLYDTIGNLLVASNSFIYSKGILSKKMNPLAYYNMHAEQSVQYVNQEQMGDVVYQSIYSPVRDEFGNAYAYLNIPSFDSQTELKREISNFLVTIIILNAFILLIAGVIALFITNRITSSFLLIGHKMQEINLGKLNEEIVWDRDDEIGGLVKEYNKMVVKLGDSAYALAKSEREGAWREMARQVAHEIKNPLTPMKLSIQYLLKAIANDSVNVKEFSSNVARTLIEQIDHLSKIASDFSQFANIGNVRNEVFDLHEMLYSLTSLYESTENLEFSWEPAQQRILLMADKTQLNRLFTNLFLNAVEASYSKEVRVLKVSEALCENSVIIKVADNGDGIPVSMQSKIFTPNFTTKSSGTGLGLAMCKTIVEQAKGSIWFETVEGEGTMFFVELPVLKAVV